MDPGAVNTKILHAKLSSYFVVREKSMMSSEIIYAYLLFVNDFYS